MVKEKPTLVAGPWIGEFGWELMSWQGFLRQLASTNQFNMVVCSIEGHSPLYEDFCSNFIPHNVRINRRNCWKAEGINKDDYIGIMGKLNQIGRVMPPGGLIPFNYQKFIHFGKITPTEDYVVIHARNSTSRPFRNYSIAHWVEIIDFFNKLGLKVYAIGSEALSPPGAINFLNTHLSSCMDLIANAKMMLGPSSGPMHLASLCSTPHVVWSSSEFYEVVKCDNRYRFETLWNPFKTKVCVIDRLGWQPRPKEVIEKVCNFWKDVYGKALG